MTFVTDELPAELPTSHHAPCLSLYQPTHRHFPENKQDPIRFRNLVKTLEQSLQEKYSRQEFRPLVEPLHDLASQSEFWSHTLDGLAILGSPDLFRIYKLQRPVAELAIVSESFHTKPLLRISQSADRFQVLALDRESAGLFEGNRDTLDEVELAPDVTQTITGALAKEPNGPHQTVASYGGVGGSRTALRHGHGGKKDALDSQVDRFFRAVDRSILHHYSRPSGLPLMLVALPEYHGVFQSLSHNPFLMNDGLKIHPDGLSIEELRERAWQVVEPQYQRRLRLLVDEFEQAKSKGLAEDQLAQIALAAILGRVSTLLIEADREIPGHIDPTTGRVEFGDLDHPETDDLLDDLAQLVLLKGGDVVIVPSAQMPSDTGTAASYRF